MLLTRKTVELLAPAGTWEAFEAAIDAGADAVYLGGKHFNMRVHKNDFNFDDAQLKQAIEYAHARDVKLYITLNNLISEEELPALEDYLKYLGEIKPDALLVQDFSVNKLINELKLNIPIHASIMMNTHNAHAVEALKKYGITRVVVSREMNLAEVKLLKQETGIETEYFIHGDMCIAESGQCIHSGVLFGQSGNRGRCLKPCRWSFELHLDETAYTQETGDADDADYVDGAFMAESLHRLALNDMCMYRNLPELINAGVYSFKIEGRMRPPEFIHKIVSTYRKAIDRYIADPTGYSIDEDEWHNLYDNRARDFSTVFALGQTTSEDIGWSGEREPRFFSKAVVEPSVDDKAAADIFNEESAIKNTESKPILSVRISTLEAAKAALNESADVVYVGGETFKPLRPWNLQEYKEIIDYAHALNKRLILNTPRTTYRRECTELEQLLSKVENFDDKPDGVMVSNLGAFKLAKDISSLPIQSDISFNLFNHKAAEFLKDNGAVMAASSLELSYTQLKSLVENSNLPIEVLVHGSFESMICDHNFINMEYDLNKWTEFNWFEDHYALKDEAGQMHSIRMDQFGRSHIYFAKDLCLYKYLEHFMGAASLRIDAQLYSTENISFVTRIYRQAIDNGPNDDIFKELQKNSPRPLGIGVYRFQQSRNS